MYLKYLFTDINTTSCKNHTAFLNALCKQNADLPSVKGCDAYSNHMSCMQIMDATGFVSYNVSCHHITCTSHVDNSV